MISLLHIHLSLLVICGLAFIHFVFRSIYLGSSHFLLTCIFDFLFFIAHGRLMYFSMRILLSVASGMYVFPKFSSDNAGLNFYLKATECTIITNRLLSTQRSNFARGRM